MSAECTLGSHRRRNQELPVNAEAHPAGVQVHGAGPDLGSMGFLKAVQDWRSQGCPRTFTCCLCPTSGIHRARQILDLPGAYGALPLAPTLSPSPPNELMVSQCKGPSKHPWSSMMWSTHVLRLHSCACAAPEEHIEHSVTTIMGPAPLLAGPP